MVSGEWCQRVSACFHAEIKKESEDSFSLLKAQPLSCVKLYFAEVLMVLTCLSVRLYLSFSTELEKDSCSR